MNNLKNILKEHPNVLFVKRDCGHCSAATKLADRLVRFGLIPDFKEFYLNEDYDISDLTELVLEFGHTLPEDKDNCSTPQVFIDGEYIGVNNDFYRSKWNKGENKSGKLEINGKEKETPNLFNSMNL